MKYLSLASALLFAAVAVAQEAPIELDIKTTFKPEECALQAKTGDAIKVHYVSHRRSCIQDQHIHFRNRAERYSLPARNSTRGKSPGTASPVTRSQHPAVTTVANLFR